MIPKIIHLTTRDKGKLSGLFQENLEIMKTYYEDYDFRISDDADINDFVSGYDPTYYHQVFAKLPKQIMRVDTVRYLWMEAYGGIYFDFDMRLLKPWQPDGGAVLVEREWTFPAAKDITVSVHNCVFASMPKHPLWRHLLDGIAQHVTRSAEGDYNWPPVFDVTGPNAISRTITKERLNEVLDDIQILPPSYIHQKGMSRGAVEDASFIHQVSGSWK